MYREKTEAGKSCVHWDSPIEDHNTKPVLTAVLPIKFTVMGDDFKEAPTVHCNFPLLVFSLYITFKSGIAAASELFPL